jgi:hypothetical protein
MHTTTAFAIRKGNNILCELETVKHESVEFDDMSNSTLFRVWGTNGV